MRIAFSGAACTGKTATVDAFLQKWPTYTLINSQYRKIIKNKKHSKNTTAKLQKEILHILTEECNPYTLHSNVVYDRCPIDNLVYTLWAHGKDKKGFTESFVRDTIEKVKESMRKIDIIFICSRQFMPPVESNGVRETDPVFVNETDNIFKEISKQAQTNLGSSPFFPKDDSATLIDIHGSTKERLAQISLYVTAEGTAFGEDQSLINLDEINNMYSLLTDQKQSQADENKQKIVLTGFNK